MSRCPSCSAPSLADATFCARCGARLPAHASAIDDATRTSLGGLDALPSSRAPSQPVSEVHGWFLPGQVLAGRYRIAGRLGTGGMGEVYRADDLRLGQSVALKFVPPGVAEDPARREIFLNEVRVAREVTHPNVCRVHDVGEAEGMLFLSMEYIDGEDLGCLLRRIGRVPHDKAVELARQICAGLAAAHERGILHRDFKPGNIMIDGRGRARITDFGLAALAGTVRDHEIRSGTPVYMAPEQLAGREVTVRSDVFSLGLVLYELFTGKRAFQAQTIAELQQRQLDSAMTSPSELVAELDPAVERAIVRCLEPDPALRPPNALAVAAALPGGDPLAAALAAGETPSPELIAAAGVQGVLRPLVTWGLLAAFLVGAAFVAFTARWSSLVAAAPPEKPPAALADSAHDLLRRIGHAGPANDWGFGFSTDRYYLSWLSDQPAGQARAALAGWYSPVQFWYRESVRPFYPVSITGDLGIEDPPLNTPGAALVRLSRTGQLRELSIAPPQLDAEQTEAPAAPGADVDWGPLFAAAGLDHAAFAETEPRWTPPAFADRRAAWTGPIPDGSPGELRIEAAAFRGRPVYFQTVGPWTRPHREGSDPTSAKLRLALVINLAISAAALLGAGVLARRNLKLGRGDRRGALRVSVVVFATTWGSMLLAAHPSFEFDAIWDRLLQSAALGLLISSFVWVLYLALEPVVRRARPEAMVSWSRLLTGRWQDPLVGRDLLVGSALGMTMLLVEQTAWGIPGLLGLDPPMPRPDPLATLRGTLGAAQLLLRLATNAIIGAMFLTFLMSLGARTRRYPWIGYGIFFSISALIYALQVQTTVPLLGIPLVAAWAALHTLAFARFGLIAGIVTVFFYQWSAPAPFGLSSWYAGPAAVAALLALAIPLFGAYLVLRSRINTNITGRAA